MLVLFGELLNAAEAAGFAVLVKTDKNIRYRQIIAGRAIALIVLGQGRRSFIKPYTAQINAAVSAAKPGTLSRSICRFGKSVKMLALGPDFVQKSLFPMLSGSRSSEHLN